MISEKQVFETEMYLLALKMPGSQLRVPCPVDTREFPTHQRSHQVLPIQFRILQLHTSSVSRAFNVASTLVDRDKVRSFLP
jgi:hypothetical protein